MPDYGQEVTKHVSTYSNILYKENGVVKCRNNKTGVITSNTYIDPLIDTILASGDPSFEVESEVFNMSPSFDGFEVPINMQAKLDNLTQFWVPSGYTGDVWKYHPTDTVIYYAKLEGGYYDEQSPQSNLWDCISIKPVVTNHPTTAGAVYSCEFKDMRIWRCNRPIHINTNGFSWANQNYFENIYSEACVYLGAYCEHTGTYTVNQSGMDNNIFVNVSGQGTTANGTLHYPLVQGGFIGVFGQRNIFIDCNPWDLWQNPSAVSMSIGVNGNGTQIIGGLCTFDNFDNAGKRTMIHDYWTGLSHQNRAQFIGTEQSWSYALEVLKHATAGSFEQLAVFGTTASVDTLTVENGSGATGAFSPLFRASLTSANIDDWIAAIELQGLVKNANDDVGNPWPIVVLNSRRQTNAGGSYKISNRAIVGIRNYDTDIFRFFPDRFDMMSNGLINSVLHGIRWRTIAKSSDVTAGLDELIIPVSASGANRTITLPTVSNAGAGRVYVFQKTDSSANTVTIDGNGAETINGAANYVLTAQYQSVMIWCDGSNWFTQPNSSERTGKAVASGNGSNTSFTITHGLGTTPSNVFVDCSSHAIARTWTIDATKIYIEFTSAPSSGTNNVVIYWRAVA